MGYGAIPPEIISARMYAGPGSGSLRAAAQAWSGLGKDLGSAAASYQQVINGLMIGAWQGPASQAMAATLTPYATWMSTTAAQCEQMAAQANAAAIAFESAFAATVPPPLIEANRIRQQTLISTNYWGQNLPAIAETEAEYAEYWAQDSGTMYSYAGTSAAATAPLPKFAPTQPKVNLASDATKTAAGTGGAVGGARDALTGLTTQIQGALNSLSKPFGDKGLLSSLNPENLLGEFVKDFDLHLAARWGSTIIAIAALANSMMPKAASAAAKGATDALGAAAAGGLGSGLGVAGMTGAAAGLGRGALIGGLSVPPSWAAVPAAAAKVAPLAAAPSWAVPPSTVMPGHVVGGLPAAAGMSSRGLANGVVKVGVRPFVMPRPMAGG